jgi:hypothetical protein
MPGQIIKPFAIHLRHKLLKQEGNNKNQWKIKLACNQAKGSFIRILEFSVANVEINLAAKSKKSGNSQKLHAFVLCKRCSRTGDWSTELRALSRRPSGDDAQSIQRWMRAEVVALYVQHVERSLSNLSDCGNQQNEGGPGDW